MTDRKEVRKLLDDVFEEEALAIGGLAATHDVGYEVVTMIVRDLSEIRRRAHLRIDSDFHESESAPNRRPDLTPHPAIEEFLASIGRA